MPPLCTRKGAAPGKILTVGDVDENYLCPQKKDRIFRVYNRMRDKKILFVQGRRPHYIT